MYEKDPLFGVKLASYVVTDVIGHGGMANVYKGYHPALNRYGAIKVIGHNLRHDPKFKERFQREAQAIALLRHPNIVQILDFGEHTIGYFMVMEFIEGYDLETTLKLQEELLPLEKVIRIIKDIASALDYAHGHKIIHRDVKPSNIIINTEGQAILTDFGLVMTMEAQGSQATKGTTFGTPHYIAPEQAMSSAAALPASDIYSLGIVLYEMATGQLPFDDDSPLSVALMHISDLPLPPTKINPDLPIGVEAVILKTLAKDASDRYTTATEMATALELAWTTDTPITEHPSGTYIPMIPSGVPSPANEGTDSTIPSPIITGSVVPSYDVSSKPTHHAEPQHERGAFNIPKKYLIAVPIFAILMTILSGLVVALAFLYLGPTSLQDNNGIVAAVIVVETPTSTPAITPSPSPSHTFTFTPEPTETPTSTATDTPTFTATPEPTATSTATATAIDTATATPPPTATFTNTPMPLPTATPLPMNTPVPEVVPAGPITRDQLRGKILFRTDRETTTQIYYMEADGSNQQRLDDWAVYLELQHQLRFSPRGEGEIAVRDEGNFNLWWVNNPSGFDMQITKIHGDEYDPAWSPIDNRIALVSESTGITDIYLLNLSGSSFLRLTTSENAFDKHPTWSPDGQKIAFWSDRSFSGKRQIWVIDLATRIESSLSDNPFNDWDPVWVP